MDTKFEATFGQKGEGCDPSKQDAWVGVWVGSIHSCSEGSIPIPLPPMNMEPDGKVHVPFKGTGSMSDSMLVGGRVYDFINMVGSRVGLRAFAEGILVARMRAISQCSGL